MAKTAYSTPQAALRTPRSIEADLFAKVTARLRNAQTNGTASFAALASAVHENRKLWTMLAADVAEDDNGLPAPLRAQIFYLAEFTQHHSSKVLTGAENVEVLIEINTAILRGLSQHGSNT